MLNCSQLFCTIADPGYSRKAFIWNVSIWTVVYRADFLCGHYFGLDYLVWAAQSGAAWFPDAAMPIISNANHDFSNLSVSDDSSLDRIFTEIPETETIKVWLQVASKCVAVVFWRLSLFTFQGVHYQRAQFIHRPEDLVSVDHALLAVINVGGNRYTFPWSTLEQFPLTRLGRLCGCRSLEDIANICDDYDETRKEFFFDRSPSAFRVILNFLAAGKLRLLREMCVLSLHDELNYWGVEMAYMERCCKRKMYTRIEEVHEMERHEEERRQRNAMQRVPVEETRYRKVMNWLRDMVENPHSGLPGKIFACLSVIMVAVTVVSLCISTMPDLREEEDRVSELTPKIKTCLILKLALHVWFSSATEKTVNEQGQQNVAN